MARKPISPWFMYRRTAVSIQDGAAVQDLEFDFNLGQNQAIEVASSMMGIGQTVLSAATTAGPIIGQLAITLHRRTGTLTDVTTPSQDTDSPQDEVLQSFGQMVGYSDEAGGQAVAMASTGRQFIDWKTMLGEHLLLVANVTMRVDPLAAITGTFTWNGIYTMLLYRYVTATAADLVRGFIART